MSDSPNPALKVLIVLFVFPTFTQLVQFLTGFVLSWLILLLPQSAQDAGLTVLQVVTTIIGLLGGFLISRMIWPREAEARDRPTFRVRKVRGETLGGYDENHHPVSTDSCLLLRGSRLG